MQGRNSDNDNRILKNDIRSNAPEVLSPAGSPEALEAAVKGGADAVYIGGKLFNARLNAKNFTDEQLVSAVKYCHKNGVRLYVTLNTLIYDKNMEEAIRYAHFLYKSGVDALIVADMGLAVKLREYIPDFPLHASTQASGHNTEAAEYFAKLGFTRMVCARELKKNDLTLLCKNSPIEIEAFVHGALCVSHSGQCLFSSLVGGRSGNRGECAQPCRLPYNGGYPLSLKDNCLARHITELIECGVASLKIEGRMKSPDYVYAVTSTYRRLVDERRNATEAEIKNLEKVFSRSGFTDGYFTGRKDGNMLGIRTAENKTETSTAKIQIKQIKRTLPKITLSERKTELPPSLYKIKKGSEFERAKPQRSARFYNPESIPAKLRVDGDKRTAEGYFDIIYLPLEKFDGKKANGVSLPPVIKDSERESVQKQLKSAYAKGARHALVGNMGHIELAREFGFTLHGDFRLNVYNNAAFEEYSKYFEDIIISPELTLPQIRDVSGNKSVIVYGRVPLMLLEKRVGQKTLVDRKKVAFPMLFEGGREIIVNSVPFYMADKQDILKSNGIFNTHFVFTVETAKEVEYIINAYINNKTTDKEIRRIK